MSRTWTAVTRATSDAPWVRLATTQPSTARFSTASLMSVRVLRRVISVRAAQVAGTPISAVAVCAAAPIGVRSGPVPSVSAHTRTDLASRRGRMKQIVARRHPPVVRCDHALDPCGGLGLGEVAHSTPRIMDGPTCGERALRSTRRSWTGCRPADRRSPAELSADSGARLCTFGQCAPVRDRTAVRPCCST